MRPQRFVLVAARARKRRKLGVGHARSRQSKRRNGNLVRPALGVEHPRVAAARAEHVPARGDAHVAAVRFTKRAAPGRRARLNRNRKATAGAIGGVRLRRLGDERGRRVPERVPGLDEVLDVPVFVHDAVDVQVGRHGVEQHVVVAPLYLFRVRVRVRRASDAIQQRVRDALEVVLNLTQSRIRPRRLRRAPPVVVRGSERVEQRVLVVAGQERVLGSLGREQAQDHELVEVRDVPQPPVEGVQGRLGHRAKLRRGEAGERAFRALAHVRVHRADLASAQAHVLLAKRAVHVQVLQARGGRERDRGAGRHVAFTRHGRHEMRVHPVEPSIARLGRRRRRLRRAIRGWHVRRRDARASTHDRRPGAARGRALASPNLPAASGDVEK